MLSNRFFQKRKVAPSKTVIYIFGMGKSGTSLVSQIVQDITDYRDKNQTTGRMDNVLGFFENKQLVKINSEILSRLDIKWPVGENIKLNELIIDFPELEKAANRLFADLFKDNRTLVFKDPRLTVTLPFWLKLSKQYANRFIYVFRHPGEVALSMAKAAGFNRASAFASWEVNNRLSLNIMKEQEVLMLSYDELMSHPRTEILRIYGYLGLIPDPGELAEQIFTAVPEIRHFTLDNKDSKKLPLEIASLYNKVLAEFRTNSLRHGFDAGIKTAELTDDTKVKILRARIKKLDAMIRRQFDEMQNLGVEYQNQLSCNLRLAEENKKLYENQNK